MLTIFKYRLELSSRQYIEVPCDAEFLTVQLQRGEICLWAVVDPGKVNVSQEFVIRGTGHPLPDKSFEILQFLGTVQTQDAYVWHVFRVVK